MNRVLAYTALVLAAYFGAFLSVFGVLVNYYEWGKYSCSDPQTLFLNCGSIFWSTVILVVVAVLCAALLLLVAYRGLKRGVWLHSFQVRPNSGTPKV